MGWFVQRKLREKNTKSEMYEWLNSLQNKKDGFIK